MKRQTLLISLCAVIGALALAPAALASTLSKSGGVVTWTGDETSESLDVYDSNGPVLVKAVGTDGGFAGVEFYSQSGQPIEVTSDPDGDCTAFTPAGGNPSGQYVYCEGVTSIVANAAGGDDDVDATGLASIPIAVSGGDGVDGLWGGGGNDTVNGDAGDDTFYDDNSGGLGGGGGNDTVNGGEGDDAIGGDYSQAGTSVAGVTEGDDTLNGGPGRDEIYGGGGNDMIDGGAGDDANHQWYSPFSCGGDFCWNYEYGGLYGGDGTDTIRGGAGNDYADGGDGNDDVDGGDDRDAYTYQCIPYEAPLGVSGGGCFSDYVYGGVSGGWDDDTVRGGGGDDYVLGYEGNDVVDGGDGNDGSRDGGSACGGGGEVGGCSGFSGSPGVYGAGGDDTVTGGDGRDEVEGGWGADTTNGDAGDDWVYEEDDGSVDDASGGDGIDQLFYDSGPNDVSITLDDEANDGETGGDPDAPQAQGKGSDYDPVNNFRSDIENVEAWIGCCVNSGDANPNDYGQVTVTGDADANVLETGNGHDTLTGGDGADTMSGNDGDDTFNARDGYPDYIWCGAGTDTVVADQFDTVHYCENVDVVNVRSAYDKDEPPIVQQTTPPPDGTPGDSTPPRTDVTSPSTFTPGQLVAGFRVSFECNEDCKLSLRLLAQQKPGSATFSQATRLQGYNVVVGRRTAGFGVGKRNLRVRPCERRPGGPQSKSCLKRFNKALNRRLAKTGRVVFKLFVVTEDRAGNRTETVKRITVRKRR